MEKQTFRKKRKRKGPQNHEKFLQEDRLFSLGKRSFWDNKITILEYLETLFYRIRLVQNDPKGVEKD